VANKIDHSSKEAREKRWANIEEIYKKNAQLGAAFKELVQKTESAATLTDPKAMQDVLFELQRHINLLGSMMLFTLDWAGSLTHMFISVMRQLGVEIEFKDIQAPP